MDHDKPDFSLDSDQIIYTTKILSNRIEERFPGSGLSGLCRQLLLISEQAKAQAELIEKPIRSLRLGVAALITLIAFVLIGILTSFSKPDSQNHFYEYVHV